MKKSIIGVLMLGLCMLLCSCNIAGKIGDDKSDELL